LATSVVDPLDESLAADWMAFVIVLEEALAVHRRRFFRSYRRPLEPWHEALFDELQSPEARSAFGTSWVQAFSGDLQPPEGGRAHGAEHVLRQELRGVTERGTLGWLRRRIGLREAIKAGGTLLGTMKDLFDLAPGWFKALITIGEEAADVATGG